MNGSVLVTGACGGIGKAVVADCLRQGFAVFANGRDEARLCALCEQWGGRVFPLVYDVTDEAGVKSAFREIQKRSSEESVGPLVGLVNVAGVMCERALAATTLGMLREQLEINLVAAFHHAQFAARLMARHKMGSIVNVVSQVGELGSAGMSAYSASKAGLGGVTRSLAKELAPLGVRVNAVSPGFIATDMTQHYDSGAETTVLDRVALGRAGTAEEVAKAVGFLLSSASSYITGHVLPVDGLFVP